MGDITLLLAAARAGEIGARDRLFARVYAELQRLAGSRLGRESTITDLDAASLVHEAFLRLNQQVELPSADRRGFFAYASNVMRSVIVDHVRERNAAKRGSGQSPVTLQTGEAAPDLRNPDAEALEQALLQLGEVDARCVRIVEMRFYAGLSVEDVAAELQLSPATVKREWQKARAFLLHALKEAPA